MQDIDVIWAACEPEKPDPERLAIIADFYEEHLPHVEGMPTMLRWASMMRRWPNSRVCGDRLEIVRNSLTGFEVRRSSELIYDVYWIVYGKNSWKRVLYSANRVMNIIRDNLGDNRPTGLMFNRIPPKNRRGYLYPPFEWRSESGTIRGGFTRCVRTVREAFEYLLPLWNRMSAGQIDLCLHTAKNFQADAAKVEGEAVSADQWETAPRIT